MREAKVVEKRDRESEVRQYVMKEEKVKEEDEWKRGIWLLKVIEEEENEAA